MSEKNHGCKKCNHNLVPLVHCVCFENGRKEAMKEQAASKETAQNAIEENDANQ